MMRFMSKRWGFRSARSICTRSARGAIVAGALVLVALGSNVAHASSPVEAVGLFKDRAMLRVLGNEHYMKVGDTSPEGAHLDSATSEVAMVTYRGESYRLTLSDAVGGSFATVTDASISIMPDARGQYRVRGSINGRVVDFLVDTGASMVAISERDARSLGIDFESSNERAPVVTAQGQTQSYVVNLSEVVVGGIETRAVRAAVIPGSYPADILLGMSFLTKVSMEQADGVLRLKQK